MMTVEMYNVDFTILSSGLHRFHEDVTYAILFFSEKTFFYTLYMCTFFY